MSNEFHTHKHLLCFFMLNKYLLTEYMNVRMIESLPLTKDHAECCVEYLKKEK